MRIRLSQIWLLLIAFLILSLSISACGGGGDSNSTVVPTPTSGIGSSGGAVTSSDGEVAVSVPQGALSQQTDITVDQATNPPSGNVGVAYEFGPSGTTFSQPVTISITYDETTLPQGVNEADLRLAEVENGQWVVIADSSVDVAANKVTGTTTHFSVYGVVAEAAYTSGDLQGTWYGMDINTPQKGFSDPAFFGFDFSTTTVNSDGSGTSTCNASSDSCTNETFPSGTISISQDGLITYPLGPNEADNWVMGGNKDLMIEIFRNNNTGEEHQVFGISVKKAASYSMADLTGSWYGMSINTPLKGFSDPAYFGFDFVSIALNNDGTGTETCITSSDICDGIPEPITGMSISQDGIITNPSALGPGEAADTVMGANKDIIINIFREDNSQGDPHQILGILVKKAASYSMSDLAGTWYAITTRTPQSGFSNTAFFGFEFNTLTLQSDGTGTITCNASSDICSGTAESFSGISISQDGIITDPLGTSPNEAKNWVMGASKDIMIQIYRDNNVGNEIQDFIVFVKKAE